MAEKKNVECVRVAVRCRPISSQEMQDQRQKIVDISVKRGEIVIRNPVSDSSEPPKTFSFDNVYDENSAQETIYKETAFPIVDSVLEGYNGTIFAYGQTGTGKTHTMEGKPEPPELRGIIPRSFDQVFSQIEATPGKQFLVRVSFLELYNEQIRDLLANNPKNKLELKEKPDVGVYVKDLISFPVQSVEEMHQKLQGGRKNRAVGATKMNEGSSRSHSIFSITVEASDFGPDGQNHITMGKLNLVDLAGSERQSKTKATGDQFIEAVNINQSLTTLGNVISALVDPKSTHIPYRDSKLTRLLQDSLGGNTKTVMIANIGPADWNFDETLGTLRYANRAKNIKNKPKINEDPKDAMLREFQEEINRLKAELEQAQGGAGVSMGPGGERIVKVQDEQKIKEMEEKLAKEKEEIRIKAEEERQRIEKQKNLAEEEKLKLLDDLRKKEDAEREAKENQGKLIKKLKKMEEKLLIGTKEMEKAAQQEKEFRRIQKEIEEKKEREAEMARQIALKEEENIMKQKTYASQQEEVEDKRKKIQKLFQMFNKTKSEIKEQQEEFNREREIFQDQIRELTRQIKLRNLIVDQFIPQDEATKIELRSVWSEEIDEWIMPNLHLSGNSLRGTKPDSSLGFSGAMSDQAKTAKSFGDNQDTDGLNGTPKTLEQMLSDDEDYGTIVTESQPNVYYVYTEDGIAQEEGGNVKDKKKRGQSAAVKKNQQSAKKKAEAAMSKAETREAAETNYPKGKGLASRKNII